MGMQLGSSGPTVGAGLKAHVRNEGGELAWRTRDSALALLLSKAFGFEIIKHQGREALKICHTLLSPYANLFPSF